MNFEQQTAFLPANDRDLPLLRSIVRQSRTNLVHVLIADGQDDFRSLTVLGRYHILKGKNLEMMRFRK